jgi:hypothetical protein
MGEYGWMGEKIAALEEENRRLRAAVEAVKREAMYRDTPKGYYSHNCPKAVWEAYDQGGAFVTRNVLAAIGRALGEQKK